MKNQTIVNRMTLLWLFSLLSSVATLQIGIRTQKYNLARLGSAGIVATVPFGARIFLPPEDEIRNSKRRNSRDK